MVFRWELVAEMFMAAVGRYKAYDICHPWQIN
jgi:hypothetical protein